MPGYLFFSQSAVAISRLRIITFTLKIGFCEVGCKENFPPVTTVWHSDEKKVAGKRADRVFYTKNADFVLSNFGPNWPRIGRFLGNFYFFLRLVGRLVRYAVRMRSIRSDRSVR
jgi:hypothetical protein